VDFEEKRKKAERTVVDRFGEPIYSVIPGLSTSYHPLSRTVLNASVTGGDSRRNWVIASGVTHIFAYPVDPLLFSHPAITIRSKKESG
jgi:hypothetical protein